MNEDFTRVSGHVAVLRRRGWIIALLAVLGALGGATLAPLSAPDYSAETVVLVPQPADVTDTSAVETQVEVVSSDPVVSAVIEDLGLDDSPADVLASLSVEVVSGTTALSITATRASTSEAADLANSFAANYADVYAETRQQRNEETVATLEEQLDVATSRLIALREALPAATGAEKTETQLGINRQQQRETRLVGLLADAQDPTLADQPVSVLQEAVAPREEAATSLRGGILGLVLGMLLGAAIAYALHHRDDRIRDEAQLVAVAGRLPLLGRIPISSRSDRRAKGGVGDPGGKLSEAYRGLAVNLRLRVSGETPVGQPTQPGSFGTGEPAPVVVITSAAPREGKSSVARNVAITLAGTGLRVVLVDADLRQPTLASRFSVDPGTHGLADALADPSSTAVDPVKVGIDNLRLLTAGPPNADPATLLGSAHATQVWRRVREQADLVLVDTAPVLYAAETLDLASGADRVVVVVEQGRSTAADLAATLERLDLVGVRPSGIVLNKVAPKDVVGGYYFAAR